MEQAEGGESWDHLSQEHGRSVKGMEWDNIDQQNQNVFKRDSTPN